MRQILILAIILSALWSCDSKTKKVNSVKTDNKTEQTNYTFEDYILALDQITLPLKHNPLGQLPELSKNYDKSGFELYKHT